MTILIVEDSEGIRALMRMGLKEHKVTECEYLGHAKHITANKEFDAIVLDLVLKDSSDQKTIAAIPELRKSGYVVVVTGMPDESGQLFLDCMRNGATSFFHKNLLIHAIDVLERECLFARERKRYDRTH